MTWPTRATSRLERRGALDDECIRAHTNGWDEFIAPCRSVLVATATDVCGLIEAAIGGAAEICRDQIVYTTYLPGTVHDGTEGKLYNLADDPLQHVNLWSDPARRARRDDLIDDLRRSLPTSSAEPRPLEAPV